MSKKTLKVNKERLEAIKQHSEWAARQEPLVEALANFTDECMVFAPAPAERSTGEFDHTWHIKSVVLVPDYCEEGVAIPANSVRLGLMNDHGKVVTIGTDPLAGAPRRRYVELDADLEVILPGGAKARMEKKDNGYIVKEPEEGAGG